jgi:hypothetical protein
MVYLAGLIMLFSIILRRRIRVMTNILLLLQNTVPLISKTTSRQLGWIILGMLMMTGRVTMLVILR